MKAPLNRLVVLLGIGGLLIVGDQAGTSGTTWVGGREKRKAKAAVSQTCAGAPADKSTPPASAPHSVTLGWKASVPRSVKAPDTIAGYYVYRILASQNYTEKDRMNPSPLTGTQCVDRTVAAQTTYFYSVRAVSQAGAQSEFSREIKVTVPQLP